MAKLDYGHYDYYRMIKYGPITKWEDIKEGETYHIPPTIIYNRREFICERKNSDRIEGKVRECGEIEWRNATFFRQEITMRFIVKKQKINNH